uniref:hypothetical protein n=1 Tax=Flavonifractor plautii TaxID=292800 RepID=UPI003D7ED205
MAEQYRGRHRVADPQYVSGLIESAEVHVAASDAELRPNTTPAIEVVGVRKVFGDFVAVADV